MYVLRMYEKQKDKNMQRSILRVNCKRRKSRKREQIRTKLKENGAKYTKLDRQYLNQK